MQSDPIRHVVVLMFENHSFDEILGCLRQVYPKLDGVDPESERTNRDPSGNVYRQEPTTETTVEPDPKHELRNVLVQMQNGNSGFVLDYSLDYQETTSLQRQRIMGYYELGVLPATHELAQHFTICDHWFSSVPGPTWTNRFFVHSGTSLGRVEMPTFTSPSQFFGYDQDTIFDRLNEREIPWRVYYGDVPQSLALTHQQSVRNAWRYYRLEGFLEDASGPEVDFPQYTFIEPSYIWDGQNDDHPPHSTMAAQGLLADVYNAIRANEALWNSTLLVILYDEHGGFYDHVVPPSAVPPDGHREEYSFDQLGIRVPALLVSPWVDRGVVSTQFDHTSLLRYLSDKWNLSPLTARVAQASSFASAIRTTGDPREDTPPSIPMPMMATSPEVEALTASEPLNENQQALINLSQHLEPELESMAYTATPGLEPSTDAVEAAKLKVRAFLQRKKVEAGEG